MAKTKEKEHKSRKKLSRTAKENWAIGIVALLILSVVVYECYTATHVRLQTYTAKETTVYRTIETTALAVREEHTVSGPGGVTVQCVADGQKIAKDGKVALRFQSEADAKAYSQRTALKEKHGFSGNKKCRVPSAHIAFIYQIADSNPHIGIDTQHNRSRVLLP